MHKNRPPVALARSLHALADGSLSTILGGIGGDDITADATTDAEAKGPRDISTGQASGKRQHGPITLV